MSGSAVKPVVVVGGGIAGLVAARTLARAGSPVVVLDGGALGGAVTSRRLDGLDLDVGAEGFATRGGTVLALLEELGLGDVVRPEPIGTRVYRPTGSIRIPDGAVLGIPTDLRDPALDQLGAAAAGRARQDAELPATVGADATSLGELVRARMGEAVVDAWLRPLVAGVHRLDVDAIAPELLQPGLLSRLTERGSLAAALAGGGGEVAGLRGGITQLVGALVADLEEAGGSLRPGRATEVQPDGAGWIVGTEDGTELRAAALLLACPPWSWPSGLPTQLARAGAAWPAPRPVDVVTLVMASDGGARRSGVIVADGGGEVAARALTYSSAKWAWVAEAAQGRAVLRLTYDAAALDGVDAVAQAVADAAALTGADWSREDLRAADRTGWLMPRTAVEPAMSGHRDAMRSALAETGSLEATGGWLAGSGLAWAVADGIAAAQRLLD